ncbi:unnamed protein product, partial [Closterium sp. Naga37s-1]
TLESPSLAITQHALQLELIRAAAESLQGPRKRDSTDNLIRGPLSVCSLLLPSHALL